MTNDPLNLDEAGEWVGLWWLPDGPDETVPGVLRYDADGGLSLALIGAFEDRIMSNPRPGVTAYHEGTRTWDVIHGAADQREITLLGTVPNSSRRTFGARVASPDKQTVTATVAIIGAHVSGDTDPAFASAEVSVEDLGLWAATSVFEGLVGAPDGRIDGTGRISVKPVEAQSVVVDDTEYRLVHTHTLPYFDQRKGGAFGRMKHGLHPRRAGRTVLAERCSARGESGAGPDFPSDASRGRSALAPPGGGWFRVTPARRSDLAASTCRCALLARRAGQA